MPSSGFELKDFLAVLVIVIALYIYKMAASDRQSVSDLKKELDDLRRRVDWLGKKQNEDFFVVDLIAGIAKNLHKRILLVTTRSDDFSVRRNCNNVDVFEIEATSLLSEYQKFQTELGLFSATEDRRLSALRSLANLDGDLGSLELMQRIEKGEVGRRDGEIVEDIKTLIARLKAAVRIDEISVQRTGQF